MFLLAHFWGENLSFNTQDGEFVSHKDIFTRKSRIHARDVPSGLSRAAAPRHGQKAAAARAFLTDSWGSFCPPHEEKTCRFHTLLWAECVSECVYTAAM